MRDGVKLFTTIYAPKDNGEKHPVLMMRTPYSVAPYGKDKFSPRLYITHWKNYLAGNYIMVMQDVRGKYMSEGKFEDVRPFNPDKKKKDTDEASDTYDTIEWLINNVNNNNGNVGVFGISYPGFYSTMAALCNHPALKAVSPQAPVTDWFMGDDFNPAFAGGDVDGDDRLDLLLASGDRWSGGPGARLELFLQGPDGRFTDATDASGLDHPAGDVEGARALLDLGVNINARDRYGQTALMYAASANSRSPS